MPLRLGLMTPEWYADEAGGGIGTYCRVLAGAAVSAGHHVVVFAATGRARRVRRPQDRLTVIPVPVGGLPAGQAARAFAARFDRFRAEGGRIDVMEAAEFGGVAAELSAVDVPVTTRLHTPLATLLARNEGRRIYRDDAERCALEERQVRGSALVTSPSRWLAGEARNLWGPISPPVVIPNPVPIPPACAPMPPRPARVLYLGRLEYRKGVLTLAAAARRWLSAEPAARLTFAGADTRWAGRSMRDRMREILGPHGDRCRFLPSRPPAAVAALIDRAHLVVLPSLYENFAYAGLEAMARGRPVLATTGSGFPEMISPGRTGFLVPPGDPDALADALTEHTRDTAGLAATGLRARHAAGRFAAAPVAARLCAAYGRIATRPPARRAAAPAGRA
ncbi:glycosyltransferase family 4 protein [Jidongwangia harbinensis]|uniref:glycosyltransferase family 4 protein n=1 Tax=Jidongwangia harbinensis TaxID=2878561 RepID=UPI001CDA4359|nr:glycosyltransferase family 4 protein [Jidongwangia harbinensis]MCA2211319.1 glycosyltransferase family 4 protein [Jidongwangia harbinensis]